MITIDPPSKAIAKAALTRFASRARSAAGLRGTVDILLTGDATLRTLNRSFRGKDKPTDVLSFPAPSFPAIDNHARHIGDLAISLSTAARQAAEHGHSLDAELRILILHGMLHLAGLDHERDKGEMAAREAQLRQQLNLPQNLIARAHAKTASKKTVKRPAARPAKTKQARA